MMNPEKLVPCPYCGAMPLSKIKKAQLIEKSGNIIPDEAVKLSHEVVLYCSKCLTSTPKRIVMAIGTSVYEIDDITLEPVKLKDGIAEARAAWNRRANDDS